VNTAVLLDIDGTITPPRQPIEREMVQLLCRLSVPFHVAAGSHLPLLQEQFFHPLFDFGFRGAFDAFVSNGAVHYRADYREGPNLQLVSEFDIRAYLGEKDYAFLIQVLSETLDLPEFQTHLPIQIAGERIVYRGSMVNCSPIGRALRELDEAQRNRAMFVEFDHAHQYRARVMAHMKKRLARLVEERNLTITLGGQTSFDIGVLGQDKTKAVTTLIATGAQRVVFLGDALFDGGNDAAIRALAENWPKESPVRVEAIQVESWFDTMAKLKELGFTQRGGYWRSMLESRSK
jgi:hydroxymethylpyrimidine pyrophosphatase-like HAD family hydrolase